MTLIRYCWESTCEQGNYFISRHVMARFTRRFIRCHVMAGCNHRFISCHGVVRSGLPTVYDGYMVWYAVDFLNML